MFYFKKIYYELRLLRNDLLEIRDILRQIEGHTGAEMLTIDLISRNPKLQPLVVSHNSRAEGTKTRSKKDFIALQTIQRHYGIEAKKLKQILGIKGIEFGTHFFKEGGFKGHAQSMFRASDLLRVQKALEKAGFDKKTN